MARVEITVTNAVGAKRPGGTVLTLYESFVDGMWFKPGSSFFVIARSDGTGAVNIRLLRKPDRRFNRDPSDGRDPEVSDPTSIDFAVPGGGMVITGRLPADGFVQPDGTVHIDLPDGASANVSFAVVSI